MSLPLNPVPGGQKTIGKRILESISVCHRSGEVRKLCSRIDYSSACRNTPWNLSHGCILYLYIHFTRYACRYLFHCFSLHLKLPSWTSTKTTKIPVRGHAPCSKAENAAQPKSSSSFSSSSFHYFKIHPLLYKTWNERQGSFWIQNEAKYRIISKRCL